MCYSRRWTAFLAGVSVRGQCSVSETRSGVRSVSNGSRRARRSSKPAGARLVSWRGVVNAFDVVEAPSHRQRIPHGDVRVAQRRRRFRHERCFMVRLSMNPTCTMCSKQLSRTDIRQRVRRCKRCRKMKPGRPSSNAAQSPTPRQIPAKTAKPYASSTDSFWIGKDRDQLREEIDRRQRIRLQSKTGLVTSPSGIY